MRIVLQLLYTKSFRDLARIVVPNIVDYCVKRGYNWNILWLDEPYDAFEKIRHIQRLFEADEADVVMSLDCDLLITNYDIKVEDFLDEEHDFYVCKDFYNINCGTFIIKKSEWSKFFLGSLIILGKQFKTVYCEQDAVIKYMDAFEGTEEIKILPHPSINSYKYELYPEIPPQTKEQGQWEEGCFIMHLAALGMQTRLDILNETKQHIVYE